MRRTTLYPALALAALLAACASEATMPLDGGHQMGSRGRSEDWGTIGSGGRSNDWGTLGSGHRTDGGLGSGTGGFTASPGGGMGPGGLTAEPDSGSTTLAGHMIGSGG